MGTCSAWIVTGALALVWSRGGLSAQQSPPPAPPGGESVEIAIEGVAVGDGMEPGMPLPPDDVEFEVAAAPIGFGGTVVKGAPYSAEAVTEVVRTLSDGNRIVRQSTASVYRDSGGRTRREQGLAMIGALVGNADEARHVIINDPQGGVSYILNPLSHTAHKLSPHRVQWAGQSPPAPPDGTFEAPLPPPPGGAPHIAFRARTRGTMPAPLVESLGKQTIEGVEADGTRSTTTIPAGQIGNEQPIRVVFERWYSSELKVLVQSKRSDPRYGDSTYHLTNIIRAEPAASLFEVPSDFTVTEGPPKGDFIFRRELRRQ